MSIQDPVVQVSGLRKTYPRGFEALRGIDFEIERGKTFALLGPSGAGKSTTIEILEGSVSRAAPPVREQLRHFAGFYPSAPAFHDLEIDANGGC